MPVCRRIKGPQVHKETWWWTDEVERVVEEIREWYRIWNKSKSEANGIVYNQMKKNVGKVLAYAKEAAGKDVIVKCLIESGKGN